MSTTTAITTDTHLYFYSGREHWSNWHCTPGQISLPDGDGFCTVFQSSEQCFMWLKAYFFGDHAIMSHIENEPDPREVKGLGRQIRGYDDKAWECVREGMMTYACYLKYSQNPTWAAELKATGDRILVEASPVDRIWGIGRTVEEAAAGAPWDGRNLLGQALMKVRGML